MQMRTYEDRHCTHGSPKHSMTVHPATHLACHYDGTYVSYVTNGLGSNKTI